MCVPCTFPPSTSAVLAGAAGVQLGGMKLLVTSGVPGQRDSSVLERDKDECQDRDEWRDDSGEWLPVLEGDRMKTDHWAG